MTVDVECYSGYRADERPLRFRLGERWLAVDAVDDRWYGPEATYFRVKAEDGCLYVLRHAETEDVWTVEAYRR
ncbi:MAG: hypothetical protein LAQ30_24490 [Acidobacteriia bacterium]|nr:hypothetical protein [Terriglobia bacterium]